MSQMTPNKLASLEDLWEQKEIIQRKLDNLNSEKCMIESQLDMYRLQLNEINESVYTLDIIKE